MIKIEDRVLSEPPKTLRTTQKLPDLKGERWLPLRGLHLIEQDDLLARLCVLLVHQIFHAQPVGINEMCQDEGGNAE
eukprot:scaffold54966_cov16-Tisochrysis_lutea.AAC.3